MLLPTGKPLHQNLNTTYTNFTEMLHDLRANRLSGYIRISFWEYEGILIYDTGSIINAIEENKDSRLTGIEAAHHILFRAKQKDGEISVHSLPSEVIIVLSSIVISQPLGNPVPSIQVPLNDLVTELTTKEITGYIEVTLNQGKGIGLIYIHEGVPVDSILKSSSGNMASGLNILPVIQEAVLKIGGIFQVFEGSAVESFEQSPEITAVIDLPELLSILGEMIRTVETVIDTGFGLTSFEKSFKRICAEKSKNYSFMDPFTDEFDYKNGIVSFAGSAKISDFLEGVNDSLVTTVSSSISRKSKFDVNREIRTSLREFHNRYQEKIEKFGLDNYFATLW